MPDPSPLRHAPACHAPACHAPTCTGRPAARPATRREATTVRQPVRRAAWAALAAVGALTIAACRDDPVRPLDRPASAARPLASASGAPVQDLTWYLADPDPASPAFTGIAFGAPGDRLVPARYTGDAQLNLAVWRPSDRTWYIRRPDGSFYGGQWGAATDSLVPADYDGDGRADIAVWRPNDGTWWVFGSATNAALPPVQFGAAEDVPLPGRYTAAAGAAVEIATWRPSTGVWYVRGAGGALVTQQWGMAGDVPVPADYDGDGRTDYAVWRRSTGTWYVLRSGGGVLTMQFGLAGDTPVATDYDGDGRADPAVWRPGQPSEAGTWYIQQSSNGLRSTQFGLSTDLPAPGRYAGAARAQIATVRVTTRSQAPVASVGVSPASATLTLGGAPTPFTATPRDAAGTPLPGRDVTWASSNAGVAAVDAGGRVTAVAPGAATITAASEGVTGSAAVTVTVAPPVPLNTDNVDYNGAVTCSDVAHVWVRVESPTNGVTQQGTPIWFTGVVVQRTRAVFGLYDAAGQLVRAYHTTQRSGSNCVIAHEPEAESTDGLPVGLYYVYASFHRRGPNGRPEAVPHQFVQTLQITPRAPVASVSVSPNVALVFLNTTASLTAVLRDASGQPVPGDPGVAWTSDAPGVASASPNGITTTVTGRALGSTLVRATVQGRQAQATVVVEPPTVVTQCTTSPVVPVPGPGYVLSDYWVNHGACPSNGPFSVNRAQHTYVQSVQYGSGAVLQVCKTNPYSPPPNWTVVRFLNVPGRCGNAAIGFNVVEIRRN